MTEKIFLDTYALIKMVEDDQYLKDSKAAVAVTLNTNLLEFYYYLLRNHGSKIAKFFLVKYSSISVDLPFGIISFAGNIKLENKKKKLSYFDVMGYAYALQNNLTFITGDRAFKGMKNVKIVR